MTSAESPGVGAPNGAANLDRPVWGFRLASRGNPGAAGDARRAGRAPCGVAGAPRGDPGTSRVGRTELLRKIISVFDVPKPCTCCLSYIKNRYFVRVSGIRGDEIA